MNAPRTATYALCTLAWMTPVVAHAQAASQASAQALFEEGRRLMTAGRTAEACPKLAESQKLDPGAGTLLNLAACYDKNGQTASAWATYKEAAAEAERTNRKEWATKSRQRAQALEATLSRLSIVVSDTTQRLPGITVKRDGVVVGAGEWNVAIPVDPGAHRIEAAAPGYKPYAKVVDVARGRGTTNFTVPPLEVDPAAKAVSTPAAPSGVATAPVPSLAGPASSPAPLADGSGSGSPRRTVGLAVGAVGVAGLAVGSIFGLQALAAKKDAEPRCTADLSRCNQAGLDAVDDAKSKATISTIGFAAGGALLATGIVLVLTAPNNPSAAAALVVTPTRGGASGALRGSF